MFLLKSHRCAAKFLVLCVSLLSASILFTASAAFAESLIEFQKRVLDNAKSVTEKAKGGDSEIQDFIKEKYDPQTGEEFSGGRYDDHPLKDGSLSWMEAWLLEDSAAIASHFFECLDLKILGGCLACGPGVLIEFWWPEAAFETNDYCQGMMMDASSPMSWGPFWAVANGGDPLIAARLTAGGCFLGDMYRKLKDEMIRNIYTIQLKDQKSKKAEIPKGLRSDPNWGRSRTIDDGGQFYEAHAYRTAVDFITANADIKCISECFPTPKERFPTHFSESPWEHMPLWRIPELSVAIPMWHADEWNELFGKLPLIALSVGLSHYGTAMSPIAPHTPAPMLGEVLLKTATCSSYRSASDFHSKRGRSPVTEASQFKILPGADVEDYQRLCFPQSMGQLFPVTGYIPVTSHKTGPLGAGRRIWEMGSADKWTDYFRFNYYNDYPMKNLYRKPNGKTYAGDRDPDKWQRSYPEISSCFRTRDVDTLDNNLFPMDMKKTSLLGDKKRGEDRYIHWNRRVCCISLGCCPWLEE